MNSSISINVISNLEENFFRYITPSLKTMERWLSNGIAKATDGCKVEPDGSCPHGCKSWLLHLYFI